MTFTISVAHSDIAVDCEDGETVIDAVERAGYAIPYSCRKGVCSSCEGRIVRGEASVRGQGVRTGPADGVLLCQARPHGDIEVAPAWIRKVEPVSRKTFDAKVARIARPAADVAVIKLRLPIGLRAPFVAGQYLRVILPDGDLQKFYEGRRVPALQEHPGRQLPQQVYDLLRIPAKVAAGECSRAHYQR